MRWTKAEIEYLSDIAKGRSYKEISHMLQKRFGHEFKRSQISVKLNYLGITTGRCKQWTEEEIAYLSEITPGRSHKEIHALMEERYGFTLQQVKTAIKRYGFNTGRTGRFEKGHVSHNKGKKGYCAPGAEKGHFKKGNIPLNRREIGDERVSKDGYIYVKIQDGHKNNNWKMKHVINWEKEHGPVPEGHCLIFLDGDKENCEISNLELISRAENVRMNKNKLFKDDPELTKTGVLVARVMCKAAERR